MWVNAKKEIRQRDRGKEGKVLRKVLQDQEAFRQRPEGTVETSMSTSR